MRYLYTFIKNIALFLLLLWALGLLTAVSPRDKEILRIIGFSMLGAFGLTGLLWYTSERYHENEPKRKGTKWFDVILQIIIVILIILVILAIALPSYSGS